MSTDIDQPEIQEWEAALRAVLRYRGSSRAQLLLDRLQGIAAKAGLSGVSVGSAPNANSPEVSDVPALPEKEVAWLSEVLCALRWNALAMVIRGGKRHPELGGHIATYQSIAVLYEIGMHYFFQGTNDQQLGDCIYFQGHASPGNYARSFLEGYFDEARLDRFRQEVAAPGLSSYPHPWLMPGYWEYPTVSMGLGPYMGIYQARFLKYLQHRGFQADQTRHVWCFCGDGEMSEPESLGAIGFAGREKLDNLIFVINCNLQRLDGPVWGNGQVIEWFASQFAGAGWRVIKLVWGRDWQALLNKDTTGQLQARLSALLDGDFQNFGARGGAYIRQKLFAGDPQLEALVADLSDEQLERMAHGGQDFAAVHAAYQAAVSHKGQPVVILAKTVKGHGMGKQGEGKNTAHQQKKLSDDSLLAYRDRFDLPLSDDQAKKADYYRLDADNPAFKFMQSQREKLGGPIPRRRQKHSHSIEIPSLEDFSEQMKGTGDREVSSTMAFSRLLSKCLKHSGIKDRVVPIMVDESRTFGLEGLFRQIGIYSSVGQQYEPEDRQQLSYYAEKQEGQILQEGINEAGGMASWIAAATAYSHSDQPMVPFYVYYSMFGYQRVGDFVWAAGDLRARGFIIGGTAGRTTLAGEGLQHQDGHNLMMFNMVPNCQSYDPCFAYEYAVIMQHGLQRMLVDQADEFFYITAMNENYKHPAIPEGDHIPAHIIRGLYAFSAHTAASADVQLIGSGAILCQVIQAAEQLGAMGVTAAIWSATSLGLLRRDIDAVARHNRLHPDDEKRSFVRECFDGLPGPVIAATDYLKLHADQLRSEFDQSYYVLGTDGFGRSDTRAELRTFFEVDAEHIVDTTLYALVKEKRFDRDKWQAWRQSVNLPVDAQDPMQR